MVVVRVLVSWRLGGCGLTRVCICSVRQLEIELRMLCASCMIVVARFLVCRVRGGCCLIRLRMHQAIRRKMGAVVIYEANSLCVRCVNVPDGA